MMLISLFKKNLEWLFWIQLRQGFDQQHFYLSWIGAPKKWQVSAFAKIIPWKPESVQLTTEYTQNNSLVFEITMFLGKAYLNMNLQYGCAHNFSCANKNLFRTILLYFKSFSDQSIYLRPISPQQVLSSPKICKWQVHNRVPKKQGVHWQDSFLPKRVLRQNYHPTSLLSEIYHKVVLKTLPCRLWCFFRTFL